MIDSEESHLSAIPEDSLQQARPEAAYYPPFVRLNGLDCRPCSLAMGRYEECYARQIVVVKVESAARMSIRTPSC